MPLYLSACGLRAERPARSSVDIRTAQGILKSIEAKLSWDAMELEWRSLRGGWCTELNLAISCSEIAQLLRKLEEQTRYSAVKAGWRDRRGIWLKQLDGSRSVSEVIDLLNEFDAHLLSQAGVPIEEVRAFLMKLEAKLSWEAMESKWRSFQGPWQTELKLASSPSDLAQLLRELEEQTRFEAVSFRWRERREQWLKNLDGAVSYAEILDMLREFDAQLLPSAIVPTADRE